MSQQGAFWKKPVSRRKFLFGIGVAGISFGSYAKFVEPTWLEIGRHEIKLSSRSNQTPLKILHLSDLHASFFVDLEFIAKAISLGLSLKPDLICVTGDFVTSRYDEFEPYAKILAQLPAAAPTFASLGNHDGGRWATTYGGYKTTEAVQKLLQQSKIPLLLNRAETIRVQNWNLNLVGLGDLWAGDFQTETAFGKTSPTDATIVLSHNPDTKEALKNHSWQIMLSGHTHGGQFRMPLIGAPFAPVDDKRFIAGLYSWENRWLHITKGIGNVHGLRFNCRPEVSLLTLV